MTVLKLFAEATSRATVYTKKLHALVYVLGCVIRDIWLSLTRGSEEMRNLGNHM